MDTDLIVELIVTAVAVLFALYGAWSGRRARREVETLRAEQHTALKSFENRLAVLERQSAE